jgi:hypothetical protein
MKTNKKIIIIATSVILATFLAFATIIEQSVAMTLASQMTFGGGGGDVAQAVALWGTKKVIVGYTNSFGAGDLDAFIAIDDGTTLSMYTFGTSKDEQAFAVTVVGNFAYIVGRIMYDFPPNNNYFDIFVARWDLLNNQLLGFKAIGQNEVPLEDGAFAVAADLNYIFVTGRWRDEKAFLAILHTPTFNLVLFRQLDIGGGIDIPTAIGFSVVGATYRIIIGGVTTTNTFGPSGDIDAFLARIDFDGVTATKIWALRFGTSSPDGVTSIQFVNSTTFAVGGTLANRGFVGYFTVDGGFLKARATVFPSATMTSRITSISWNGTHLAAAGYFYYNPAKLEDVYILLIDSNGLLVDAKGYGGGQNDRAHGVALDNKVTVVGVTNTLPNVVFTPPFTYREVQVVLHAVSIALTPPYMLFDDISSTFSVLTTTFNENTLFPPFSLQTPTFNSPVYGDVFVVRFST